MNHDALIREIMKVSIPIEFIRNRMDAIMVLYTHYHETGDEEGARGCSDMYISLQQLLMAWEIYMEGMENAEELRDDSKDPEAVETGG